MKYKIVPIRIGKLVVEWLVITPNGGLLFEMTFVDAVARMDMHAGRVQEGQMVL